MEPRGERRADLRTAHQTRFHAMLAGQQSIPLESLMLSFEPPDEEGECVLDAESVAAEPDEDELEEQRIEFEQFRARMAAVKAKSGSVIVKPEKGS